MPVPAGEGQILQMQGLRWGDPGGVGVDSIHFDNGYLQIDTGKGLQILGSNNALAFNTDSYGVQFTTRAGVAKSRITSGNDGNGRVSLTNLMNSQTAAIDFAPGSGVTLPGVGTAIAEITIYRTVQDNTNFERFNIEAASTPSSEGGWRFGQEVGGTGVNRDVRFATEKGVTAGTEVYININATRVGDSQPIEIWNGHLSFVTSGKNGAASTRYISSDAGANDLAYNVPTGGTHQFKVNAVNAFQVTSSGITVSGTAAVAADGGAPPAGQVGFTNTNGLGNGASTGLTALALGTGSGPSSLAVAAWKKVYDGATTRWMPLFS